MIANSYKDISREDFEKIFTDTQKIYSYGMNIQLKYFEKKVFKRVGAHLILVPSDIVTDAFHNARYKNELEKEYFKISSRPKNINGNIFFPLVDNKTDQAREVIDYIVSKNIATTIYLYSEDSGFWFFHDLGHGYLSEKINNFYDNVYGFPEMLINIFACIKMKQYGLYSRKVVENEVIKKCYKYKSHDKKYFLDILDSLELKDD